MTVHPSEGLQGSPQPSHSGLGRLGETAQGHLMLAPQPPAGPEGALPNASPALPMELQTGSGCRLTGHVGAGRTLTMGEGDTRPFSPCKDCRSPGGRGPAAPRRGRCGSMGSEAHTALLAFIAIVLPMFLEK